MMMALQCDIDLTQQTIRRPSAYNSTRSKKFCGTHFSIFFHIAFDAFAIA